MLHSQHVIIYREENPRRPYWRKRAVRSSWARTSTSTWKTITPCCGIVIRMAACRRAIEKAVSKDTVAAGSGLWFWDFVLLYRRPGAQKVYAIERRPDIIFLAEELAKANGLGDEIEFIEGSSRY